ncbi:inner centromere protein A-like [Ruditapes philippinarum]|uniref:inner centromere protein A-like n=1 Tax=Ruditapes philippinarum TaxID=129788 RepID=UPI00295B6E63|nr:inner centromere protein A-like [Ruditapes philippinarum]
MDKLLQLESPLFYNEVATINKKVFEKIRALEESFLTWMDEVLEDARKVFNQSDNVGLLPKTPSAKRKGRQKKKSNQTSRRKLQVEEDEDDYVAPQEKEKPQASKLTRSVFKLLVIRHSEGFLIYRTFKLKLEYCETVTETWIQSASKTIKPPTKTSASPKSVTKTPSVKDSLDGASPSTKENSLMT